ncbi:MAG: hypothetical protein HY673_14230 [Chloroflexi bacterium]|nr:hypothetical protein [Chloroflexota bacterium]
MAKEDKGPINMQGRLLKAAEQDPVKFVGNLLRQAEPELARAAVRWRRYRSKYRAGLQYLENAATRPPAFFANYLYGNVETVKSNVPRNLPAIAVRSMDVDDRRGDDTLSRLLRADLTRMDMRHKVKSGALHHASITGLGWLKLTVEEDEFENAQNALQAYPPEAIIVDPMAVPFYDGRGRVTARFIIERRRDVSYEEVTALFPDFEVEMDEDGYIENFDGQLGDSPENRGGVFGERKPVPVGKVGDLLDCWINTFARKKPWHRIVLWGNKLVSGPEPSPFDHPNPPHVPVFVGYDDGADSFYLAPIGEIEEIEPLQDKANMLDLQIFKNIRLIVNRQRVVNKSLGLSASNVDNTENRVYAVPGNPKDAIHWDVPPMLNSDVYSYRMMVDYMMEVVSGVTGTQAGRKPTGIQAAKAIAQLSQNSDRRIEDKRDDMAYVYQRIGAMALSNVFQFWTTPRLVKLLDGAAIKVIADYPDSLKQGDEGTQGAEQPDDEQADLLQQRQEWRAENQIDLVLSDLKHNFTVQVSMDSPLPERKEDRAQLTSDALRLGGIDRRAFLEALDWPDREGILQRLDEAAAGKEAAEGGLAQMEQQHQQVMQQVQAAMQQMPQMVQQMVVQMVQQVAPQVVMQVLQQMMGGQPPMGAGPPVGGLPVGTGEEIPPEALVQTMMAGGMGGVIPGA